MALIRKQQLKAEVIVGKKVRKQAVKLAATPGPGTKPPLPGNPPNTSAVAYQPVE